MVVSQEARIIIIYTHTYKEMNSEMHYTLCGRAQQSRKFMLCFFKLITTKHTQKMSIKIVTGQSVLQCEFFFECKVYGSPTIRKLKSTHLLPAFIFRHCECCIQNRNYKNMYFIGKTTVHLEDKMLLPIYHCEVICYSLLSDSDNNSEVSIQ
jgi:hypothetical protein